jgi:glycosyltransferase involved in cell wall biosynthesis
MKILHITPHLGGGIGAAYSGITQRNERFDVEHEIVLLERPEKTCFVERIRENGVKIFIEPPQTEIEKRMNDADIVQINWWHHPLMAKFLYNFPNIPVRLVCWVHVSGCTYPYLRTDFLKKFDKVFFTTPYSYETPEIANWKQKERDAKTSVIYGMGDASRFFNGKRKEHNGFRIGYMGTLDFSKLHPNFVEYCAAAASVADDITFVMIGDTSNKELILQQAKEHGIAERFEFRGFCEDVQAELSRLDCMGYLLNPYHFGTSENVILETMAAGVPIVMMNQNTEKYIVENKTTGFLVNNQTEYGEAIRHLYCDLSERHRISQNAKKRIRTHYNVMQNTEKLLRCYEKTIQNEKQCVTFHDIFGNEPSDWFLYFVGKERELFLTNRLEELSEIFKGESKSSVKHFAKYFPDDRKFMAWFDEMKIYNTTSAS